MVTSILPSSGYRCDGELLPSVSSILRSDPKYTNFNSSLGARRGSYSSSEYANDRGHHVHNAARKYLITGEVDLPERYFDYWEHMHQQLMLLNLTDIIWAEQPLLPELKHLQNGDQSCVWNSKYKYCGCPDLVGSVGGVRALCEFKTSTMLFRDNYLKDFSLYASWFLYHQASMQVAAYAKAFEKLTKIPIDVGIIIVATPSDSQLFVLEKPQLNSAFKKFKQLLS